MSGGLCYALSLSLILISLPAAAVAFNISYSAPTQCGPFNVTWEDGATITTLRILPFDAQAIVINMGIDAAHDKIAKTYTYTVDNLPLGSGTQFVAAADYAFIHSLGGTIVSLIQTVGDSSNSSCLTLDTSPISSFFTLDPATPEQCSNQTVSWNFTFYAFPPFINVYIPGGQAILDIFTSYSDGLPQQPWFVDIREGTQVVLLVQGSEPSKFKDLRTSPLMTVTANNTNNSGDCLSRREHKSTVAFASTTSASTTVASSVAASTVHVSVTTLPDTAQPANNVNVSAIIGGVVGGLGFIAIACATFALPRFFASRRSRQEISAFEDSSTHLAPPSPLAYAAPGRKRPLNAQGLLPPAANMIIEKPRINN